MPNIYLRNGHEMPKICPRYAQDIPKIFPIYVQDMPNICPRNPQDMPEVCPRIVSTLEEEGMTWIPPEAGVKLVSAQRCDRPTKQLINQPRKFGASKYFSIF